MLLSYITKMKKESSLQKPDNDRRQHKWCAGITTNKFDNKAN